jgi:hypothetical protein
VWKDRKYTYRGFILLMILQEEKDIIRFWSKVEKTETCWIWTAATSTFGHGRFRVNRKSYSPHRLSYELFYGDFDQSLLVCHTCDNPRCVNPDHLFLGTYLDNNRDMFAKGRGCTGDKNGMRMHPEKLKMGEDNLQHKLTKDNAKFIIISYYNKELKPKQLMDKFGICKATFWKLIHAETWKVVWEEVLLEGLIKPEFLLE